MVCKYRSKQLKCFQTCKTLSTPYVAPQDGPVVAQYFSHSKLDANSAEARARAILLGLGFKQKQLDAKFKTLSGGWRSRCSLASALLQQPDLVRFLCQKCHTHCFSRISCTVNARRAHQLPGHHVGDMASELSRHRYVYCSCGCP